MQSEDDSPTNTIRLGDREIPRIGLGTNRLRISPANVSFIRHAVEVGAQMIDTAHLYTDGESEQTVGLALSGMTTDYFIATKGGYGGAGQGRPDVLHRQIDESLERLRRRRLDLYYLHRVDPETPLEDSLRAIKERVDAGQIARVGISEVTVDEIERATRIVPIAAVQNNYSLAERKHDAVVDYCAEAGIVFVPFFPLRGADTPAVQSMAKRHGATPRQIALAWLLRRSPTMLPIPGTLSLEHLQQNVRAQSLELSDDDVAALR
jgi:aryl-alcohol dehydrogenase-like predicted oxidoreductase